jgi:hypothetical protein
MVIRMTQTVSLGDARWSGGKGINQSTLGAMRRRGEP